MSFFFLPLLYRGLYVLPFFQFWQFVSRKNERKKKTEAHSKYVLNAEKCLDTWNVKRVRYIRKRTNKRTNESISVLLFGDLLVFVCWEMFILYMNRKHKYRNGSLHSQKKGNFKLTWFSAYLLSCTKKKLSLVACA